MAHAGLALAASRAQAQELAVSLTEDAARLAETAAHVTADGARLTDEVVSATRSFELTEDAVDRAVAGVTSLAGAVRGTTASAERMTALAVQLADLAQATQRSVARLDDRSARLAAALNGVAGALHLAGAGGEAVRTASVTPAGAPAPCAPSEDVTDHVRALLEGCAATLREATEIVRDLMQDSREALGRTTEVAALVRSNHEVGQAITQAVQRQGEEIAGILQRIYDGRTGFAAIRASVDAIGRVGTTQAEAMTSLGKTALRLPDHADAVTDILRDVPDFSLRDW